MGPLMRDHALMHSEQAKMSANSHSIQLAFSRLGIQVHQTYFLEGGLLLRQTLLPNNSRLLVRPFCIPTKVLPDCDWRLVPDGVCMSPAGAVPRFVTEEVKLVKPVSLRAVFKPDDWVVDGSRVSVFSVYSHGFPTFRLPALRMLWMIWVRRETMITQSRAGYRPDSQ
jgi:hypothetical protein